MLIEPGEGQINLTRDCFHIEFQNGRLTLHAWNKDRNLVRKVTGLSEEKPGRLDLIVERFGKRTGTLQLLDTSRPQTQSASRRGARLHYRETFGRLHALKAISGLDHCRSDHRTGFAAHPLARLYPRAFLKRGSAGLAELAPARSYSIQVES